MVFWIINFALFNIYLIVCYRSKKDNHFLVFSYCHLCLVSCLRGLEVGRDTLYYAKAYNYLSNHKVLYNHAMSSSKAFILYLKLWASIYSEYNGYILASAIPTLAIIFFFIYKYSANYYLSVYLFIFMFFYFNSLNISRQYMAMALVLLVFYFSDIGNYLGALIVGCIAVGVHSATLPCVLICIVVSVIEWNAALSLFFVCVIPLTKIVIPLIVNIFVRIVPQYVWLQKVFLANSYLSQGRSSLLYCMYGVFTLALTLYWVFWINGKVRIIAFNKEVKGYITDNNHEVQLWQRMMAMVAIATMLYAFYARVILFNRMASILYLFIVVLLANIIENIKGESKVIAVILLAPLVPFTYLQLANGIAGVKNYSSFVGGVYR